MSIVSVALLPTQAYWYWTLVRYDDYNNSYVGWVRNSHGGLNTFSQDTDSADSGLLYAEEWAYTTLSILDYAWIFNSREKGGYYGYNPEYYETYRATVNYFLNINFSPDGTTFAEITVKVIHYADSSPTVVDSVTQRITTNKNGNYVISTPGFANSRINTWYYVEFSIRLYASKFWAFGDPAHVDMSGTQRLQLNQWSFEQYVSSGGFGE